MKKYKLTNETITVGSRTLYRIEALVELPGVSIGDKGGYIQSEDNLSQVGNAWVYGNACVSDNACVSGNACVSDNADIIWFSHVGSENGTLTVCKSKDGLQVSRGCFFGTDSEFMEAVDTRHGLDSRIGKQYSKLIAVARSRILGVDI